MRLGIFGGSFDPVHLGHLLLAESCRQQCRLDAVWLLPAGVPPHKRDRELTLANQRIEMLELAIAGNPALAVSRYDVDRGGVSYTVDALRHFRQEDPARELFLLVGADMLHDLPRWREAGEICRLAVVAVVRRPGADEPDFDCLRPFVPTQRIDLFRQHLVEMPAIGISSSEIRRRVAEGRSIRYQTPRAVEEYILSHALYRGASGS